MCALRAHKFFRALPYAAVVITFLTAICYGTETWANADHSPWYWSWRQPPYEIVIGPRNYPYVVPSVELVAWGGVNQDIVFALTSDPLNSRTFPEAIYSSADEGVTWDYVGDIDPSNDMTSLVIHPLTSTLFLAGGTNYYPPGGIYRSEDEGVTWTNVLQNKIVYDIEIDALNPERVYASTCCLDNDLGGIYRSEDAGLTWNKISDQLMGDIEASPISTTVVFGARAFSTTPEEGVYQSDNGGVTWTQIAYLGGQSHILIDDLNPDRMFAYGGLYGGIWRTEDGGRLWTDIAYGLPSPMGSQTIQSVSLDSASANSVWVGLKYGGMFVSVDAGEAWTEVNSGLPFVGAGPFGPQCTTSAFRPDGQAVIGCSGRLYLNLILDKSVFLPLTMR